MTIEADKTKVPAGDTGTAGAITPEVSTETAAALETERKARVDAEQRYAQANRNYDNLRGAYGRMGNQLKQYRDAYGDLGAEADTSAPPRADVEADQVAIDPAAADVALIRFRQEHNDWNTSEGEGKATISQDIDNLLKSQRGAEFVAVAVDGKGQVVMDVRKTLENAYREVKLQRYESANAEARKAQEAAKDKNTKMRAAGFVSGDSAVEVPESLDLDAMSADEFAQKVLAPAGLMNDIDPIRSMRGLRRK